MKFTDACPKWALVLFLCFGSHAFAQDVNVRGMRSETERKILRDEILELKAGLKFILRPEKEFEGGMSAWDFYKQGFDQKYIYKRYFKEGVVDLPDPEQSKHTIPQRKVPLEFRSLQEQFEKESQEGNSHTLFDRNKLSGAQEKLEEHGRFIYRLVNRFLEKIEKYNALYITKDGDFSNTKSLLSEFGIEIRKEAHMMILHNLNETRDFFPIGEYEELEGPELEAANQKFDEEYARIQEAKQKEAYTLQASSETTLKATGVSETLADFGEFMLIPAGEFVMGSSENEEGRYGDETPHKVVITHDFYMAKTEITQEQWEKVMGHNPSRFKGAKLPVESMTWWSAVVFANMVSKSHNLKEVYDFSEVVFNVAKEEIEKEAAKGILTAKSGKVKIDYTANGFRLPTEAEWEYAARGGTQTPYSWDAWENKPPMKELAYFGNWSGGPKDVGSYAENQFGLKDMAGNVWEWTNDWYGKYEFDDPNISIEDPRGPKAGSVRVIRGGCWINHAQNLRSANRGNYWGYSRGGNLGFRLLRTNFP